LLPPPPASPEQIGESLAMVAFFFGGGFLIAGLFSKKHPQHGTGATLLLTVMGVIYSIYILLAKSLPIHTTIVIGLLLTESICILALSLRGRKQKRREANLRRLEEIDGESDT